MNLLKCNHCGRPFYDSEKACPFCGHAANLSANNRVTKTISDPKSHKLMEDFLAGNLQHPDIRPVHSAPVIRETEQPEPIVEPVVEPVTEPDSLCETQSSTMQPSDTVLERAESIAAVAAEKVENKEEIADIETNELETSLPRKKRRWWIWVIILIILLGISAAVYLKWDFVYEKVTGLIGG